MNKKNSIHELWEELKKTSKKGQEMVSISEMVTNVIEELVDAREKKGLSQRDLGILCGLKQSAIARMETLQAVPRIDTVAKIAHHMGMILCVSEKIPTTKYVFMNCSDAIPKQGTYSTNQVNSPLEPKSFSPEALFLLEEINHD